MRRIQWKRPIWKLVIDKNSKSLTNSIYEVFDIVIQSCVISCIHGSRTIYSKGPFTLKWQLPSGKVKEKFAKYYS